MTYERVHVDGRTFRVDACGLYDELIEVPLDDLDPRETYQSPIKIHRYAVMYRDGSPFPPISICGTTPDHHRYSIANGHHRYLAAVAVEAETIMAWTCSYVPFTGAHGKIYYRIARMSDTEIGRRLAHELGREWCPRCGRFLNYQPGMEMCLSCAIEVKVTV